MYNPGPAYYKNMHNSSFEENILSSSIDKSSYYIMNNGVMKKRHQLLAVDKTKRSLDKKLTSIEGSPGPGHYSP